MKKTKRNNNKGMQDLALLMAVYCVRNTIIENYHAGISPVSKTGDYSDVKVVTPYGEIPWNDLSRIDDEEMKVFNIEVSNKIYTFLQFYLNEELDEDKRQAFFRLVSFWRESDWDTPTFDSEILKGIEIVMNGPE